LGQFFRNIRKRRGDKKAAVATAHLIVRIIYSLMRDKTEYREIDVLADTSTEKKLNYLLKQIDSMGFDIQLTAKTAG